MVEPERLQAKWRMSVACWISRATRAKAQTAFVHSHPHTHAHACAHPRAHTHTEKYVIFFAFPLQQWFSERVSVLSYTYIGCLHYFISKTVRLRNSDSSFSGDKAADHSSLFSAEVKNEWSHTSTPLGIFVACVRKTVLLT